MKKKLMAVLLALTMVITLLPTALAAGSLPFKDVADDFWAEEEISWAYEEGLMNGTTDTTFNPGGKVTRQQVWMILARMSGYAPEDMAAAKGWAVSTGVSDGSNPGNPVTRQQLVTLIWRAEGEPAGDATVLADYPDAGSVSAYAKEAMAWAVENGVIGGTTAGTLNPQGNANRAQLAVILFRFCGQEAAAETYTVTFQLNYGDEGAYKTVKVEDGDTVKEPSDPSRSGYTFKGWYTKSTSGTKFDFDTEITKDITLYAQWTKTSSGGSSSGSSHSHTYGAWTPNGDGTHSRDYNCGHTGGTQTATCTITYPSASATDATHVRLCSVCKDSVTEYHEYGQANKCVCGKDITPTEGETENPVAVLKGVGYTTISAAIDAASAGDVITVLAGDHTFPAEISKSGITIMAANENANVVVPDATSGQALTTITGNNVAIIGLNFADAAGDNDVAYPIVIDGDNVTIEDCTFDFTGTNYYVIKTTENAAATVIKNCDFIGGMRPIGNCVVNDTLTIDGCTFTDSYYAVHVDHGTGVVIIKNCEMDVTLCAIGSSVEKTILENNTIASAFNVYGDIESTGNTFKDGNGYADTGFYFATGSTTTFTSTDDVWKCDKVFGYEDGTTIIIDGVYQVYTNTHLANALSKNDESISVKLLADVTYDIGAWQSEYYIGGADTKTITIDGENGDTDFTLTFNHENSDWNYLRANNEDLKLVLKNVNLTNTGENDGPWNRHDIRFYNEVELENVTSNVAIALLNDASLKNVNISDSGNVYALWIEASGRTVTIDGGTFTAGDGTTTGRGIKIADEYVSDPALVKLNVSNATFMTGQKAAILVTSTAGAEIALENVDISGVAADTVNAVWIDEDRADYYALVTVTGGTKIIEGRTQVVEGVLKAGQRSYEVVSKAGLKNLESVLADARPSEANILTVDLLVDVDLTGETWDPLTQMWIIFNGNDHTISNLTAGFDSTGRRSGFWGYAGAVTINDLTLENINVTGSQAGTFAGSAEGLKVNNCYLEGTNTVTFASGVETWNGIGAITGVLTNSNINVEIVSGATVTLNKGAMTTDSGCTYVDNLTGYISANKGVVTNNGTVTSSVAVSTDAALDAAIKSGATTVTLGSGNYIIPDSAQGKTLTIVGNGETVIATQDDGSYEGCDYSLDGATVTFKNVVINTDSSTYTGYARCSGTYENCTINGTYTLYGNSVFNNCTFNVSGDVYNIWTWGAENATFNNCTFNSDGKAMLLYGTVNTNLTLNGCVFNDKGGLTDLKAAVEIGNDYGKSYTLTVTNTTVNGYEINDKGINTGTTLWGNKNSMGTDMLNVVVDGVDVY